MLEENLKNLKKDLRLLFSSLNRNEKTAIINFLESFEDLNKLVIFKEVDKIKEIIEENDNKHGYHFIKAGVITMASLDDALNDYRVFEKLASMLEEYYNYVLSISTRNPLLKPLLLYKDFDIRTVLDDEIMVFFLTMLIFDNILPKEI